MIRLNLLFKFFAVFTLTSCAAYTQAGSVKKINIPVEDTSNEASENIFAVSKNNSGSAIKTREIIFRTNKYIAENGTLTISEAVSLMKEGRYTEAETILSDILNENPDDPCAANNLAIIHEFEGNFESSLNLYYKAFRIDPENPIYRKNLITLLDAHKP